MKNIILVPMLYITFLYIISLCSNNWVPDEKNGPRAKYEYEPMNKFKNKVQHNNNNGVPGAAGGSEKLDSSNPISTHSGTGEKETLNINVVGKNINHERRSDSKSAYHFAYFEIGQSHL